MDPEVLKKIFWLAETGGTHFQEREDKGYGPICIVCEGEAVYNPGAPGRYVPSHTDTCPLPALIAELQ